MTDASPSSPRTVAIPWWGRLEVRVIAALALLGILCVGASAYLVQLSVGFFDERLGDALAESAEISESVEAVHRDLIDAHIEAFRGRARALAAELALAEDERIALDELLERETDVVALTYRPSIGAPVHRDRTEVYPSESFDWYDVDASVPGRGRLEVVFRIDPTIDERYQQLGQRQREIGAKRSSLEEIERAVVVVVTLASILALIFAMLAGFALARTTTKKAGELSRTMARVARGDLSARAGPLGRDELGQLARAFDDMLDELQRVQQKVSYLQRIGAWQEMARRIAHEIKNPLTPIQLAAQQLREKDPKLSPEFSRLLNTSVEIVEDEVDALRRMVSSFSTFAKMPQVRLEPVGIARILDEFERAYGHLTEHETDRLTVHAPQRDVVIDGDRQLLKQTLVNLVENGALSARDAGVESVAVIVSTVIEDEAVELWVEDNGPGIEPDRLEKVFEPYETSREQGTGLGLAIVKKIVLDHGGEVWAESSDKLGGARLRIRLPRRNTAVTSA